MNKSVCSTITIVLSATIVFLSQNTQGMNPGHTTELAHLLGTSTPTQHNVEQRLLSPEKRKENSTLIASIGSKRAASLMALGISGGMAVNLAKNIHIICMNPDPTRTSAVLLTCTDALLTIAPFIAGWCMETSMRTQENKLIALLTELDQLNGDAHDALLPQQSHPAYKPYSSLIHTEPDEMNLQEQEALTPVHQNYKNQIDKLTEIGFTSTQADMWALIALLFTANALKDAVVYSTDNYSYLVPLLTTGLNAVGAVGSLALAMLSLEKTDELINDFKKHEEV